MSDHDEGEKFFLDYWDFGNVPERSNGPRSNASMSIPGSPAVAPHPRRQASLFGRSLFARGFQCPADTQSCGANEDLCCPKGEDCVTISGNICCCPTGQTCTESCGACDTKAGYTSCPNGANGGCCIPGAVCEGSGCVFYGTATTVVTPITTASTDSYTATTSQQAATPVTSVYTSVSGYTTTVTVTQSISGGKTTITQPTTIIIGGGGESSTNANSLGCKSGFFACPSIFGGGCCPSGQVCTTSSLCLGSSTVTVTSGLAPERPTSVASTTSNTAAGVGVASVGTSASSSEEIGCPTGYYMCSAYYRGGCCRVGRNCDTTSCPALDTTSVLTTGPTVYVQYTSTTTESGNNGGSGSCANGWFSCAASESGGCCPSGYLCGTQSCSATNSGQQDTGKVTANSQANVVGWAWGLAALAIGSGIGMILL